MLMTATKLLGPRRRRMRRILFACLFLFAFLCCWCFLTVLLLVLQNKFIKGYEESETKKNPYRGVQMVVGHYNGNLAAEKRANLTDEQINANRYAPFNGVGEDGVEVRLSGSEERLAEDTFGINQFNLVASDRIALNRSLPDVRKHQCREKSYPPTNELPTTSVIIVYHNEAYSTLMRTVTSVIMRSSKELIKEIILVDDFSARKFLGSELDNAVANVGVRVKIIRSNKRVGLIRARLMGAKEAEGDVLTFLDSHCECTKGWLEPLLARIKENRKTVVCPIIDVINDQTFAYQKGIELFRGGFNWNLQFRWYAVPPAMAKARSNDPTQPIDSPAMAGGLFSIERKYFEELGTYDSEMDIWGGENVEISLRIWQCGGRIEILPCSHVGHVFRKASPHDFNGRKSGSVLNNNLFRVAEVWMDEWKYHFYKMAPQALKLRESIDVSERVELRKRLHCKSFQWYLETIWIDHFLPMPGYIYARIALKTLGLCLIARPGEPGSKTSNINIAQCSLGFDIWQLWLYTTEGQIKTDEHLCLSASLSIQSPKNWQVELKECGKYETEFWQYNFQKQTMYHRKSRLCLSEPRERIHQIYSSRPLLPTLAPCIRNNIRQQWELQTVSWLPDNIQSS